MASAKFPYLKLNDGFALALALVGGAFVVNSQPDFPLVMQFGVLLAYHLFLLWLVATVGERRKLCVSRAMTALYHLGGLVVLVGLSSIGPLGQWRLLLPALAVLETGWLYPPLPPGPEDAVDSMPIETLLETVQMDFDTWKLEHTNRKSSDYRVGMTVSEEYEAWVRAQAKRKLLEQRQAALASAVAVKRPESELVPPELPRM